MSKHEHLLLAFEGTWGRQDALLDADDSAVAWMARQYQNGGGSIHVMPGVGTRLEMVGKWLGGAFGIGMKDRANEALAAIDIHDPEVIDAVAFSRGTGSLMLTAEMLRLVGVQIRSVILFDSVIQRWLPGIGRDGMPPWRPDNIENFFHLMAAHEDRWSFPVHRWPSYQVRPSTGGHWFSGTHGQVGGPTTEIGHQEQARKVAAALAADCGWPGFIDAPPADEGVVLRTNPMSKAKELLPGFSPRRLQHLRFGDVVHPLTRGGSVARRGS